MRSFSRVSSAFLAVMKWSSVLIWFLWWIAISIDYRAEAQVPRLSAFRSTSSKVVIVGFVGGFVRRDDERHPEVRMFERFSEGDSIHTIIYENRRRARARRELLHWLDADGNGHISAEEKRNARIILVGASWGGSSAIRLADDLNHLGIPVLLIVQVDSVNKGFGHNDCVIPPNTEEAVNFYQTRGPVHGCRSLRPEDPARTQIVGDFRFDYGPHPVVCPAYPWFNRHIFRAHNAMDCDQLVWSQVEAEIRMRLHGVVPTQDRPESAQVAALNSQPQ